MIRLAEKRLSKKGSTLTKLLTAATLAVSCNVASAADPLKVGFVYVGPTGDAGWTYAHDEGRKYMVDQLGDQVETTFVESVAEGAHSERVILSLIHI